jgi:hypothetical protein
LSDPKFLKEVDLGFKTLVMINAHDDQIPFTVRCEVDGLILLTAKRCDLSRPVPKIGNGLDYWHIWPPALSKNKLVPN